MTFIITAKFSKFVFKIVCSSTITMVYVPINISLFSKIYLLKTIPVQIYSHVLSPAGGRNIE